MNFYNSFYNKPKDEQSNLNQPAIKNTSLIPLFLDKEFFTVYQKI